MPLKFFTLAIAALFIATSGAKPTEHSDVVDTLIKGGRLLDGTGNPWRYADIGIKGERIAFVGDAERAGISGTYTIDATGLLVTPGFIDMHSHANPGGPEARKMLPQLYQGITTVVIGVDGFGANTVAQDFENYRRTGIGANVITYVGFNSARIDAMGMSDAPANQDQLAAMKRYVDEGMRGGAFGMSSGLFYVPGVYAARDEVIEVAKISGHYGGIYDTHDRDLGAVLNGVGFLASIAEGIEIGEQSGNRVIFSHFSPQAKRNFGRAPEGAKLIEDARARGLNVMAAQHPYTATQSALTAYALPSWASADGTAEMLERYEDDTLREKMAADSNSMLEIRGGAGKIFFSDENPELNSRTLQHIADEWALSPFEAVIRIVRTQQDASVMNLDLYDLENIRFLARQDWMMTCTDGGSEPAGVGATHPRQFGAFAKKLREFSLDDDLISLPFAVRGMTSLPAAFLGISDRGMIREGYYADINVIDLETLSDKATYENSQQYSDGMEYVIIGGALALAEGVPTQKLTGRPIARHQY